MEIDDSTKKSKKLSSHSEQKAQRAQHIASQRKRNGRAKNKITFPTYSSGRKSGRVSKSRK